jgi:hypothetical protein
MMIAKWFALLLLWYGDDKSNVVGSFIIITQKTLKVIIRKLVVLDVMVYL